MFELKGIDFVLRFVLELLKSRFPLFVEILKHIVADWNVFSLLSFLYILAQLVLVLDYFCLQETNFAHQVFVKLVFMNFTTLSCKQLHFFFYGREN